jgi:hypothetical protein
MHSLGLVLVTTSFLSDHRNIALSLFDDGDHRGEAVVHRRGNRGGAGVTPSHGNLLARRAEGDASILRCQCVNQAVRVWTAPARRQIVAFCRRKTVTAHGDVVEVGVIA